MSVLPLHAVIIGPRIVYVMDHTYFVLILVHGLKINHGFEINHLCEFGPLCAQCTASVCHTTCILIHLCFTPSNRNSPEAGPLISDTYY